MTALSRYRHPAPVRRILASLVPIVCPPEADKLGLTDDIVEHVELSLRSMPTIVRGGLMAGLASYELSAALVPRHRGRVASALGRERASRYFASWWESRVALKRELAKGVKSLLCLACYEMPAMKAKLDYEPEAWIDRVSRRRLRVYSDDIERHQRALLAPDPLPLTGAAAAAIDDGAGAGAVEAARELPVREAALEEVAS